LRIRRALPTFLLVAGTIAGCASGAPAPAAPTADTSAVAPSPTSQPSETPPAKPLPAPTATPTIEPTPTLSPEDLVLSPETLGQLRPMLTLDEPGKGDLYEYMGCEDVACWLPYRIGSAAFSPDGETLAVGLCLGDPTENTSNPRHYRFNCKAGSEVRLYDTRTGGLRQSLSVHDFPLSLAFHPLDSVLAVGLSQRDVVLFDLSSGESFRTLQHSTKRDGVTWLTFTPDGSRLLSLGDDNLQVWDWQTPLLQETLRGVQTATLNADGSLLGTLYFADQGFWRIRVYKMQSLPAFTEIRMKDDSFGRLRFTPDEGLLAVIGDSRVEIWDPVSGEMAVYVRIGDDSIPVQFDWFRAFTPDGHLIVAPSSDDADSYLCGLGLWRPGEKGVTVSRHPEEACLEFGGPLDLTEHSRIALIVSPDGRLIASQSLRGQLTLWAIDPAAIPVETSCLGTCDS
jgi:WD40 repeat protein